MRMILIGPPGAGKGTQGQLLIQRLQLTQISTGGMLREAIAAGAPAGKKAEPFIKAGKLVPDEVVNALIADYFQRDERPTRFVLDGYPRTVPQAVALDAVLRKHDLDLNAVVVLEVPDDELIRRTSGRWICPTDQTPYHLVNKPPIKAGVCDLCGSALIQRPDDREATVRKRVTDYHSQTEELIPYYRTKGILHQIPAIGSVEDIYQAIVQAISEDRGEKVS